LAAMPSSRIQLCGPTLNGQAPASADELVVALWPLVQVLACQGNVGQALGGYTNVGDVLRDDLEVFPGAKRQAVHATFPTRERTGSLRAVTPITKAVGRQNGCGP
jgi:hypothetical protein